MQSSQPNRRVLVVEDEPHARATLRDYLSANGFDVLTASDGAEAVDSFSADPPDAIVLDAHLPKIDGFRFLRFIRQTSAGKTTPVIMLTAVYKDAAYREHALLHGAEYYVKPLPLPQLRERLDALVARITEPLRYERRFPIRADIRVACRTWDRFVTLCALNVSQGGMFIRAASPPPLLSKIHLDFVSPSGDAFGLEAEVVHVVSLERAERDGMHAGMGIRFLDIPPGMQRAIDELVQQALTTGSRPDAPPAMTPVDPPPAVAGMTSAPSQPLEPTPDRVETLPAAAIEPLAEIQPFLPSITGTPIEPATGETDPATASDEVAATTSDARKSRAAEAMVRTLRDEVGRLKERNLFERLGLGPQAQPAEIKRAFRQISKRFHPDRYYRYGIPELRALSQEVYLLLSEAEEQLLNDAGRSELGRAIAERTDAAFKQSAPKPTGDSAAEESPADRLLEFGRLFGDREESGADVEQRARKAGLLALREGRYADAREMLIQAVKLFPDDVELKTALDLARGYWCQEQGDLHAAVVYFQRACDTDDGCQAAVVALRELSQKREEQGKNLFRRFFRKDGRSM